MDIQSFFIRNKFILIVLVLAAVLRFAGVAYGLPLRLIADEPQFVFAAIDMVQERILIPSYDKPEFVKLLYNPPYIIYLFLFPFWVLKEIVMVESFSSFFIAARLISVAAGLCAIFLSYKASALLFPRNKTAPIFTAYFLSTSLLAIALSATARHWTFAMLLGIAGLVVLARSHVSFARRFMWVAVIAGIGIGVNQAVGALMPLAFIWYFLIERGKLKTLFRARWLYAGVPVFAGFALLPFIIYPYSLRGVEADEWGQSFSVGGFLEAPLQFLGSLAASEPVFLIFAAFGFIALWIKHRKIFWLFFLAVLGYVYIFYFSYQFVHRYLAMLLPFLALVGGFGAAVLWENMRQTWKRVLLGVFILLPLVVSVWFGYLLLRGDSRMLARSWFEQTIPAGARVIVWADRMRLTSQPETIEEKIVFQKEKDPDDWMELYYPNVSRKRTSFRALNLYNVENESFYDKLKTYACLREYDYLIMEKSDFQSAKHADSVSALTMGANEMASFGTSDERYSVTASYLGGFPWGMFSLPEFGPPIFIYRLDKTAMCTTEAALARPLYEGSDVVPQDNLMAQKFTFDKRYNLHIHVSADEPALVLLVTESEFQEMMVRQSLSTDSTPAADMSIVIPVEPGKYIFVVAPVDGDVRYTVRLDTDELFFDE